MTPLEKDLQVNIALILEKPAESDPAWSKDKKFFMLFSHRFILIKWWAAASKRVNPS